MANIILDTIAEWWDALKAASGQIVFYDRSTTQRGASPSFTFRQDAGIPVVELLDTTQDGEFRAGSFRGQLFHGKDDSAAPEVVIVKGGAASGGTGANVEIQGGAGDAAVTHGYVKVKDVLQLGSLAYADLPTDAMAAGGAMAFITDADVSGWGDVISGGGAEGRFAWYNGTDWTVVA